MDQGIISSQSWRMAVAPRWLPEWLSRPELRWLVEPRRDSTQTISFLFCDHHDTLCWFHTCVSFYCSRSDRRISLICCDWKNDDIVHIWSFNHQWESMLRPVASPAPPSREAHRGAADFCSHASSTKTFWKCSWDVFYHLLPIASDLAKVLKTMLRRC